MLDFGVGKGIFLRVAGFGGFSDSGTTWVGKTENFGDLIETFADSVVFAAADDLKMIMLRHADDLGVTARDDKGEKREGRSGAGVKLKPVSINVGLEVVNGVKWFLLQNSKAAGGESAD